MSRINSTSYVIRGIDQECSCEQCGLPLFTGERAVFAELQEAETGDTLADGVFCSSACSESGLPAIGRRNQALYATERSPV
jgi:hypothetical protein